MQRRLVRTLSAAALVSLALASGAGAQQGAAPTGQPNAGPVKRTAAAGPSGEEGPILSVKFAGGTVEQYVAALRAQMGAEPVNIAVSSRAGALPMPETELSAVSVYTAVSAIESAVEPPQAYSWAIRMLPRAGTGTSAFAVGLMQTGQFAGPAATDPYSVQSLQVFDTREVTGAASGDTTAASIESLLTAIDTAIGMSAESDEAAPLVKYHKDTGLLMIRGTKRQVEVARSVIHELSQGLKQEAAMARAAQDEQRSRTLASKRAAIAAAMADYRFNQAKTRVERARSLLEKGSISDEELRAAESQLADMEAQRELAQLDVAAAGAGAGDPVTTPRPSRPDNQIAELVRRIDDLQKENALLRAKLDQIASPTKAGGGKTTPR